MFDHVALLSPALYPHCPTQPSTSAGLRCFLAGPSSQTELLGVRGEGGPSPARGVVFSGTGFYLRPAVRMNTKRDAKASWQAPVDFSAAWEAKLDPAEGAGGR